ncbi:Uncharacterised protein [Schaalia odontolytica]|uniref:Uncharacterized protein n=1 Tax=Schaalia odontolytica TaxID=1660 RepID=A0A2X0UJP4_9ACTO|nr:Uncharacterised protein [Schaalia odontolytica]
MPASLVTFLPDVPAALIESIPGQVRDVEEIHDHPRAGEFYSGCVCEPGNRSIATIAMRSRYVLGWEASQMWDATLRARAPSA